MFRYVPQNTHSQSHGKNSSAFTLVIDSLCISEPFPLFLSTYRVFFESRRFSDAFNSFPQIVLFSVYLYFSLSS